VLLVPMLSGTGGSALAIIWALGKAVAIILAVLLVARRLMPPLLERVARTCSPELFLGETGSQAFLAASVVLMVATPQLATLGARVRLKLEHRREVIDSTEGHEEELSSATFAHLSDHVVVAGYGNTARYLVQVLHGSHLPFVITTLSPGGPIGA